MNTDLTPKTITALLGPGTGQPKVRRGKSSALYAKVTSPRTVMTRLIDVADDFREDETIAVPPPAGEHLARFDTAVLRDLANRFKMALTQHSGQPCLMSCTPERTQLTNRIVLFELAPTPGLDEATSHVSIPGDLVGLLHHLGPQVEAFTCGEGMIRLSGPNGVVSTPSVASEFVMPDASFASFDCGELRKAVRAGERVEAWAYAPDGIKIGSHTIAWSSAPQTVDPKRVVRLDSTLVTKALAALDADRVEVALPDAMRMLARTSDIRLVLAGHHF